MADPGSLLGDGRQRTPQVRQAFAATSGLCLALAKINEDKGARVNYRLKPLVSG